MFNMLAILSGILTAKDLIKEHREKHTNYGGLSNYDAYKQDIIAGVPHDLRMKKMRAGLYDKPSEYPEPHRNENGKIKIENCTLYWKDMVEYGGLQTVTWANQGKYNLDEEGMKIEMQRRKERNAALHEHAMREARKLCHKDVLDFE